MRKRNEGPTRYALYLRCSSDDQKEGDFTTTDVQRSVDEKYVFDRRGIVAGVYCDEGISGSTLNRPDWKRMLGDAQTGKFESVVVTYMSRLGRGNAYIIAEYELGKCGVKVEMVRESFTDDLAGYLNKTVTVMMDGMYPKMVAQWTRTKMQQMVEQGYCVGHIPTLGYRKVPTESAGTFVSSEKEPPKRPIIEPDEAEIVRSAFALLLDSGTIGNVRDYLKSVTGRQWTTTTTKKLLKNEAFVGVLVFGEWRNETVYPPIIERKTWDEAQQILETKSGSRPARSGSYIFYLRGLVSCPHCGCSYSPYSAKSGKVHYYSCLSHQKRRTRCPVKWINADSLHYTVLHAINRAAKHETVMHRMISQSPGWSTPDEELKSARARLAKKKGILTGQITNVVNLLVDGRGRDALLNRLQQLENELNAICTELGKLTDQIEAATAYRPTAKEVQAVWSEVMELWDDATEEDKGIILGGIVKRVTIKEKDRVALVLSPVAELHDPKFVINNHMGACRCESHELSCPAPRRYPKAA